MDLRLAGAGAMCSIGSELGHWIWQEGTQGFAGPTSPWSSRMPLILDQMALTTDGLKYPVVALAVACDLPARHYQCFSI